MISVEAARRCIADTITTGPTQHVALSSAIGRVLAEDIHAPIALPIFASSAMDGFAVRSADTNDATPEQCQSLRIVETITAGTPPQHTLHAGEAARIMTGAMVPDGADAIVPIENIHSCDDAMLKLRSPASARAHVRYAGEEIAAGELALARGTTITAAGIGFLASLGLTEVPVHNTPRICIIPTGSELIPPGHNLARGQIYESNALALTSALQEFAIVPTVLPAIEDAPEPLHIALHEALADHDMILLTGGVSVGDYDFVKETLARLDVDTRFWCVAQKPGKPLFFGTRRQTAVFGLPGNPASSLCCYYEYVRQAVTQWLGYTDTHLPTAQATLTTAYAKKPGRTHFVRAEAHYCNNTLEVTPRIVQGSHCMQSFAQANCFIVAASECDALAAGQQVEIQWLPQLHDAGNTQSRTSAEDDKNRRNL